MEIKRGEIYFADITKYDSKGSEQSGRRPVVILQNNIGNKFSPTTIIAIITTKSKRELPTHVELHSFSATIYDAENRLQNFGMVDNSYIRAYNADTNEELFKYELNEDFSLETGVIAGELYRKNGEWKFNAVGSGYNGGLAAIGKNFGLDL